MTFSRSMIVVGIVGRIPLTLIVGLRLWLRRIVGVIVDGLVRRRPGGLGHRIPGVVHV